MASSQETINKSLVLSETNLVVEIPTQVGMSRDLPRPFVVDSKKQSELMQKLLYAPGHKCENLTHSGKTEKCGYRADTLVFTPIGYKPLCDFCFCKNRWFFLFLLFTLLQPVSCAEVSLKIETVDLCLIGFVLIALVFLLARTFERVAKNFSDAYIASVSAVSDSFVKFMDETTYRHLWTTGAGIFSVLCGAAPPSFRLQGMFTDTSTHIVFWLKRLAGCFAFVGMFTEIPKWFRQLERFLKHGDAWRSAMASFENLFDFDVSTDLTPQELAEQAKAMQQASLSTENVYTLVYDYSRCVRFNKDILEAIFEQLTITDQTSFVVMLSLSPTKKSFVERVKSRNAISSAIMIALSKHYEIHPNELPSVKKRDKEGLGLNPDLDDAEKPDWFDHSYLMRAACNLAVSQDKKVRPENLKATQKMRYAQHVRDWDAHCLTCTFSSHNRCAVFLNLANVEEAVFQKFGAKAFPTQMERGEHAQVPELAGGLGPLVEMTLPEPVSISHPTVQLTGDTLQLPKDKTPVVKVAVEELAVAPFKLVDFDEKESEREKAAKRKEIQDACVAELEAYETAKLKQTPTVFVPSTTKQEQETFLKESFERVSQESAIDAVKVDRGTFSPVATPKNVDQLVEKPTSQPVLTRAPSTKVLLDLAEKSLTDLESRTVCGLPKPLYDALESHDQGLEVKVKNVVEMTSAKVSFIPAEKQGYALDTWQFKAYHAINPWVDWVSTSWFNFRMAAGEQMQYWGIRVSAKLGNLSQITQRGKPNGLFPVGSLPMTGVIAEALNDEEFESDRPVYTRGPIVHSLLTRKATTVFNGVCAITCLSAVMICFVAYKFSQARQYQGFGPSGDKDLDRADAEWDVAEARVEKAKNRLDTASEIASRFFERGSRYQGYSEPVEYNIPSTWKRFFSKEPVFCPSEKIDVKMQASAFPSNIGAVEKRTFGVFTDPACLPNQYCLNAFLVGKFLFSLKHAFPDVAYIQTPQETIFQTELTNWKLVPGQKDWIYLVWSSPVSTEKVSLALPEMLDQVVLVSRRPAPKINGYAILSGTVVALGSAHGWYTCATKSGDCGAPVVNSKGCVVGFHQIGTNTCNGFLKVTQDVIDLVARNGNPPLVAELQGSLKFNYERNNEVPQRLIKNKFRFWEFSAFCSKHAVPDGLEQYALPPFTEEALEEGLRRYDHPETIPDAIFLHRAVADLLTEVKSRIGLVGKATMEDIFNGCDKSSSPGFPYLKKYSTKAALFEAEPLIWQTFTKRPETVFWWAKLKCEVRLIGKLARTYLASPIDFTFYASQYMLNFNNRFTEAGASLTGFFSTIGMVPQKGGWQRLVDMLHPTGFAFDGERFDTKLHSFVLWWCCFIRLQCVNFVCYEEMVWCYAQTINAKIKTGTGFDAQKCLGNASGGVNTIVDNTMGLYLMIHYAFSKTTGLRFTEHVRLALNGDDSLITMTPFALERFDSKAFCSCLASDFGMKFTTDCWEPRPITQLNYLSRTFDHSMFGVIVPYFAFDKMKASLNFSRHNKSIAYNLMRALGIYAEMWTNSSANQFLKAYIDFLKQRVDENDPWTKVAREMERADHEHFFDATGLVFPDDGFLRGELQGATPRKRNFAKSLLQMEPTIKINLAPGGKQKKVPVKPNQKKDRKEKKSKRKVVAYKQPRISRNLVPSARGQVADILRSLIVPGEGTEHRFSLKYGSRPTALASVRYKLNAAFSNLKTSSTSAFLFRSALRAAMVSFVPVAGIAAYSAQDTKVTLANGTVTPYYFHLPLNNVPGSTIKAVHGPVLYPGKAESLGPQYGYYCNAGDILRPLITAWGAVNALVCSAFRYEPTGWIMLSQQTLTPIGPSYDFDIVAPGYYAIKFGEPGGVGPNLPVTVTCALTLDCCANPTFTTVNLGQLSLPQLAEQFPLVGSMRVQSASLMFTQTTPMINRGGKLGMAQIDRNTDYDQFLTYDSIASINTKIATTLDATNGGYCFLKPTDTKDLELISEFETDADLSGGDAFVQFSGGLRDAFFQITPDKGYLTTNVLLPGPVSDTIPDTRDGYWTMHWNVEYETIDQWRSLAEGRNVAREIDDAIAFLSLAPQFHSNAFHIDELMQWMRSRVKNTAAFVTEHGPELLNIVSSVVKAAGVIGALV